MNNLIGKRYGKLTVIGRDSLQRKDNHIYWICKCDCGKEISVRSTLLVTNKKSHCSCEKNFYQGKIVDLTNQHFGNLIALYPTEKRSGSHVMWHCKCLCGKELDIDGHSLRMGLSQSCGCSFFSKGEEKIKNLLEINHFIYETQKTFDSCRFQDTNALAKFDFYVEETYLIEYDGIQHFEETNWSKPEILKKIQERDVFKNKWCKENNIPLIRIPYTYYQKLSIKDLILKTSNFII